MLSLRSPTYLICPRSIGQIISILSPTRRVVLDVLPNPLQPPLTADYMIMERPLPTKPPPKPLHLELLRHRGLESTQA